MVLCNQHREDFGETVTGVLEQKGNLWVDWEYSSTAAENRCFNGNLVNTKRVQGPKNKVYLIYLSWPNSP